MTLLTETSIIDLNGQKRIFDANNIANHKKVIKSRGLCLKSTLTEHLTKRNKRVSNTNKNEIHDQLKDDYFGRICLQAFDEY
jgi:hypothetical protein